MKKINNFLSTYKASTVLFLLIPLGVSQRLYRIEVPPFGHHSWRQYDTAAIARNFHEGTMNILYPQIDWRGSSPGYVEVEFQAYSYLVAALYRVFGLHEWLGSLLNIFFYVLTALLLFQFARKLVDEKTALIVVFFYSVVPLTAFFNRSFQPDTLMCLGTLAGIYFFWLYTENNRLFHLILSGAGVSLALLIKPLNVYLAVPLIYLAHRQFGWSMLKKMPIWIFAIVVVLPPFFWYVHAFSLWETYGNSFFRGYVAFQLPPLFDRKWLWFGKYMTLRLIFAIATPPGLFFLVAAFFSKQRMRNTLLYWWLAGFAVSVLLAFDQHGGHDYYQLPLIFVSSIFMAQGAVLLLEKKIFKPIVPMLCLLMIFFSIKTIHTWTTIESWHIDRVAFGKRVEQQTEVGAPIVTAALRPEPERLEWYQHRTAEGEYLYHDPADFYLSDRKGWSLGLDQVSPKFLQTLRLRGAQYFAIFYSPYGWTPAFKKRPEIKEWLDGSYTPVEITSKWAIYSLNEPLTTESNSLEEPVSK